MKILLETSKPDKENCKNYLFENPLFIIKTHLISEVEKCFHAMEKAIKKGFFLAGFLSYEAGYAFEPLFHNNKVYNFPLVCFGVYDNPTLPPSHPSSSFFHPTLNPNLTKPQYFSSLSHIKQHLADGDTYQVNYTFKLKFDFPGSPFALYQQLKKRQPTPYSAFIEDKNYAILSLSPELFFRKQGNMIKVKPMKGTIEPGKDNRQRLRNDKKNQAENVMIVDLLRNDLGRIAKTGTVRTAKLFEVEKHPTLYQMTSTIAAEIAGDIPLYDLFRNIFPSGSVTGAPKIRTMQIIKELEKEDRKIYTGSIGFITPQRDMLFNVAIRTLLLQANHCEMGLGSGITYHSDPEQEFEECLLKARFLSSE